MATSIKEVYLLAISYASNGMESKAFETITHSEHFAFDDPLYYKALHTLNLAWGDSEEAVKFAQLWVEMRPCCSDPLVALAFAHLWNGDIQAAQKAAESATDKGSPNSAVTGLLGFTYLIQSKFEAAEEMLLHSLGKNPDSSLTRYSLSELYLGTNRCKENEPHVKWLVDLETEGEQYVALGTALEECYGQRLQREVVQD